MAIKTDATSTASSPGAGTSSLTWAHTCTGSNRILWVGALADGDKVTSVTYNGVAMTQMAKTTIDGDVDTMYLYYLVAPATGSNNIVITLSGTSDYINGAGSSYTGARQTSVPDSQATVTDAVRTSITASTTVVTDGSWLVGVFRNNAGAWTASTETTNRIGFTGSSDATIIADSNGSTYSGSQSLIATCGSAQTAAIVASFAPEPSTIAYDATSSSANVTGTNTTTFAHTCTGSNRILIVGVQITEAATTVTGITYNGVALTKIDHKDVPNGSRRVEMWYLVAPATGSNNVVVTLSGTPANWFSAGAVSYTGVKQTGIPDSSATASANSGGTNTNLNTTTVADNAWLIGVLCNGCAQFNSGPVRFNRGTKMRTSLYQRVGAGYEMFNLDSGIDVSPAGAWGLGTTNDDTGYATIVASLAPITIQNLTLTAAAGSFTYTGYAAIIGYLYSLVAAAGSYVLTGYDAVMTFFGWTAQQKNSASWTPQSKSSASWSSQSKNSSTWTAQNKLD